MELPLTEVKIPPLVSGLEEASSSLSVNIGPFLHQHFSVVLTASLDGNVQRRLTYSPHNMLSATINENVEHSKYSKQQLWHLYSRPRANIKEDNNNTNNE